MKLDQAHAIRPGEELDWSRLEAFLREQLPELAGPFSVAQFHGGHANLTYLLTFGERELVLRRPPFGKIAPGAHDMQREYRVLTALAKQLVTAPAPYLYCADAAIIGAEFVVMERRSGTVIRYGLTPEFVGLPRVEERLTDALMRATADLHTLDVAAAGLTELGKPEGFAARQLKGWAKRWRLAKLSENPDMDAILEVLQGRIPEPQAVSVVHGDLKFDNCQFQAGAPDTVTSIFDWDMATTGDPLVDLAGTLSFWPDPALNPEELPIPLLVGDWPDKQYLKDRYAEFTGFDLTDMAWYEAFACYKTAVICQQLFTRYRAGDSVDARMEKFGQAVSAFARLGRQKIAHEL